MQKVLSFGVITYNRIEQSMQMSDVKHNELKEMKTLH